MQQNYQNGNPNNQQLPADRSRVRMFQVDEFDEKAIFLCQFCGGEECAHENYLANKKLPNAIEGLNSNWITENILAMQRPSQRLIKQFNIYQKFKEKNIRTVLNLQEAGQHPYCGDGIIPEVGFSYIPQNFYRHGIHCFNQCWEDMTSTTFEHMMRIMNLFEMSLRDGGRISVHCHAGRGRTLLVICSWLIFNDRMEVGDVIKLAQEKREGVLASKNQHQFLRHFEEQLQKRRVSFGVKSQREFGEFVEWQSCALLKKEQKRINLTSVVHFRIVRELKRLSEEEPMAVLQAFLTPTSIYFKTKWDESCEQKVEQLKNEMNKAHFKNLKTLKDPRILTQLLFDFYDSFPATLLTTLSIDCLRDAIKESPEESKLNILLRPAVVHNIGVSAISTILDFLQLFRLLVGGQSQSELVRQSQKEIQKENSKIEGNISEALYLRLALMLLSKRKYFPQFFTVSRQCKLYKYISKARKIIGSNPCFLADFLQQVVKQLPQDQRDLQSLIFKSRQVESNLYNLLKDDKHGSTLNGQSKQTVYQKAKVKL